MARQILYDPATVRSDLLNVFWKNGFAETSLTDLEAATGLNRRQLYNGPGDKMAMFLQAMDDFATMAGQRFLAPLETETAGVREIRAVLDEFVRLAGAEHAPNGCMVCSVSQEDVATEQAVKKRSDAYFERIRMAYNNALTRANDRGEITLSQDAIQAQTASLYAAHVALCILGKAKRPKRELHGIASAALAPLD